ncbi:hypothetical protein [Leptolyngbya sp. PCC 6406]|uniref:hypothetical protein n=1 Tax=Leptolyngbya sp. PCC 6406 TaxID=1173264 RepID=UPI0002AC62EB|nr:hypothetical protein [Leptolyngbya sp. PCC 6406]
MTQEVTRWLAEVRTLQHQLAASRQERDQAYSSAANWRQLYDAEAQQRRADVTQMEITITTLRTEVAALRGQLQGGTPPIADVGSATTPKPATDLTTVEGLRRELTEALRQCDRLQQKLEAERADHAQTRQTLTTALGETIDAFKQDKSSSSLAPRSPEN